MCLSPLTIKNKSKYRQIGYGDSAYYTVSCGKCAECRTKRANEYAARSYAQYQYCKNNHGWSYFDTLTYDPKYVPNYKGLLHFSRSHVRNFLKRLRVNIERYSPVVHTLHRNGKTYRFHLGRPYEGKVANNLKYFLGSEYGGKTHRPHYHVIFYSVIPDLDVYTFRSILNKSWSLGFLDRIYTVHKRIINGIGACHYISEYVNKDYEYTKTLEQFIKDEENKGNYVSDKRLKDIRPFHLQSKGYGIDLINQQDLDFVHQTGTIRIPDKHKVYKYIPLPKYFERKLYYDLVDDEVFERDSIFRYNKRREREFVRFDFKKTQHWQLNDNGVDYKRIRSSKSISKLAERFEKTFINIYTYRKHCCKLSNDYIHSELSKFFERYSFTSLAIYCLYYRHRVFFTDEMDYITVLENDITKYRYNNLSLIVNDKICTKKYVDKPFESFKDYYKQDTKGYYVLEEHCNLDDLVPFNNVIFENALLLLGRVTGAYNKVRDDAYFAACELRDKRKLFQHR